MRYNITIINKLEELDKYLNNLYNNFPKKDIILKGEIRNIIREIYINIYKIIYQYNKDISMELISMTSYLNYLIDKMYNKRIINNVKYLYIGNLVISITKLLRGYINEKNR